MRKVDQNEFEREIDHIKDRVLLSEEKIKESINKLKENVETYLLIILLSKFYNF